MAKPFQLYVEVPKTVAQKQVNNDFYMKKKACQQPSWFISGEGVADLHCTVAQEAPMPYRRGSHTGGSPLCNDTDTRSCLFTPAGHVGHGLRT